MLKTTLTKSAKYLSVLINIVKKYKVVVSKYKSIRKSRNKISKIYLSLYLKICPTLKKFKVVAL